MAVVQPAEGDRTELVMAYAATWHGVPQDLHASMLSLYAFIRVDHSFVSSWRRPTYLAKTSCNLLLIDTAT